MLAVYKSNKSKTGGSGDRQRTEMRMRRRCGGGGGGRVCSEERDDSRCCTDLLLAALVASTLHAGQTTVPRLWRGVVPLVVVNVEFVFVVVVEQARRAAVNGAPFALVRAAVRAMAPHASRKLGALHDGPAPPGGGERCDCGNHT